MEVANLTFDLGHLWWRSPSSLLISATLVEVTNFRFLILVTIGGGHTNLAFDISHLGGGRQPRFWFEHKFIRDQIDTITRHAPINKTLAYKRWAHTAGKKKKRKKEKENCMADEEFHLPNNKWDVTTAKNKMK